MSAAITRMTSTQNSIGIHAMPLIQVVIISCAQVCQRAVSNGNLLHATAISTPARDYLSPMLVSILKECRGGNSRL